MRNLSARASMFAKSDGMEILDYVQPTGGAAIYTDYLIGENVKSIYHGSFDAMLGMKNPSENSGQVCGELSGQFTGTRHLWCQAGFGMNTYGKGTHVFSDGGTWADRLTINGSLHHQISTINSSGTITHVFDGEDATSSSYWSYQPSGDYSCHWGIFSEAQSTTVGMCFGEITMTVGSTVILHWLPCIFEGEYGMWDTVQEAFSGRYGTTGSITGGYLSAGGGV